MSAWALAMQQRSHNVLNSNLTDRCFSIPAHVGILMIKAYRLVFSPWVGRFCRFEPTCSAYAEKAIQEYGLIFGVWLGIKRILRCHPGCDGGYDPVPEKKPTPPDQTF
jgi:putative membrane protein insertion efficiency factor